MSRTGLTVEFSGMEAVIKALNAKALQVESLPDIKVGVKSGIAYPDGTPVELVGLVHELGDEDLNIPERSYLRSTIDENRKEYNKDMMYIIKRIFDGDSNAISMVNLLGAKIEGDVKTKITDLDEPELKDSTLKQRKGNSSNPLVDTSLLRRSIIYEAE